MLIYAMNTMVFEQIGRESERIQIHNENIARKKMSTGAAPTTWFKKLHF